MKYWEGKTASEPMIASRLDLGCLDHRIFHPSRLSSLRCFYVATTRPAPRSSSHRCSAARQLDNENGNVWTGVWTGDRKGECETCSGKGAIPCSVGAWVWGRDLAGVGLRGGWGLVVNISMRLPSRHGGCHSAMHGCIAPTARLQCCGSATTQACQGSGHLRRGGYNKKTTLNMQRIQGEGG